FFIGAALQQIGLVTATVTNTGFLTGLYVVIVPLIAWALTRHAPQIHIWSAVGLAFAGTWLLGGGTVGGFSNGDMLVAISAIFWAAHIIVVERSSRTARPMSFTAIQFLVTGAIAIVFAAAFEPISLAAISAAAPELLYVGILSSALTFSLLAVALQYTSAVEATIIVSLETVFAAIAAAWLLSERLEPIGWLGAAMMFGASVIVNIWPQRARSEG
ncbi:MAG: DMT family transporter, partial [Pseudomonadota bacterium]